MSYVFCLTLIFLNEMFVLVFLFFVHFASAFTVLTWLLHLDLKGLRSRMWANHKGDKDEDVRSKQESRWPRLRWVDIPADLDGKQNRDAGKNEKWKEKEKKKERIVYSMVPGRFEVFSPWTICRLMAKPRAVNVQGEKFSRICTVP